MSPGRLVPKTMSRSLKLATPVTSPISGRNEESIDLVGDGGDVVGVGSPSVYQMTRRSTASAMKRRFW